MNELSQQSVSEITERQREIENQITQTTLALEIIMNSRAQQKAGHALTPEQLGEYEQTKNHWNSAFGLSGNFSEAELVESLEGHIRNLKRMLAD